MKYRIVRYRRNGESSVRRRGLSLEEAQEHCNDPNTRGPGWFDGYEEDTTRRRLKPEGLTNMLAGMTGDNERYNTR